MTILASPFLILLFVLPAYYAIRRKSGWTTSFTLMIVFLLLACLRPVFGVREIVEDAPADRFVLVLDVSRSMAAKDTEPTRLERAKREIQRFIEPLRGELVGLVTVSSLPFFEVPLTSEYDWISEVVRAAVPETPPASGTDLAGALRLALQALRSPRDEPGNGLVRKDFILLFSDGENFSKSLPEVLPEIARQGIPIISLGLGTEAGVPVTSLGIDIRQAASAGQMLYSKRHGETLRQMSDSTAGKYFPLSSLRDDDWLNYLKSQRTAGGEATRRYLLYHDLSYVFGLLAFLSALFCRRGPSRVLWSPVLVFFSSLFIFSPQFASAEAGRIQHAEKLLQIGRFQEALSGLERDLPPTPTFDELFLRGVLLYRLQRFAEAEDSFLQSRSRCREPRRCGLAAFNFGNALVQRGEWQEALRAYQDAQRILRNDLEVQENISFVEQQMKRDSKPDSAKSSSPAHLPTPADDSSASSTDESYADVLDSLEEPEKEKAEKAGNGESRTGVGQW